MGCIFCQVVDHSGADGYRDCINGFEAGLELFYEFPLCIEVRIVEDK